MKKVLILVAALFVGLQAQAQLQVEGGYQHFFEQSQVQVGNNKNISNGIYKPTRYSFSISIGKSLNINNFFLK